MSLTDDNIKIKEYKRQKILDKKEKVKNNRLNQNKLDQIAKLNSIKFCKTQNLVNNYLILFKIKRLCKGGILILYYYNKQILL